MTFRITLLVVLFVPSILHAAKVKQLTLQQVNKMQKKLQAANQLHVKVTQQRYLALRKRTTKTEGEAFFQKPNRFRWSMGSEEGDWIFNGKNLYRYSNKDPFATAHSPKGQQVRELKELVDMVLSFDRLLKNYQFEGAEDRDGEILVALSPKVKRDLVRVELAFEKKKTMMKSVKLIFANKNHTIFNFKNHNTAKFKSNVFLLPKGVKIKHLR